MNYQLQPASSVPVMDLIEAINTAYADYFVPLQFTEDHFKIFVQRESLDLNAGVVALHDGQIVGSCMLGLRGNMGWIGGMGIIPEYRRQGLGRAILNYLIEQGRSRNLTHLDLEVITQNTPAVKLYETAGFEKTRTLLIFDRGIERVAPVNGYMLRKADIDTALRRFDDFHDDENPWQRHKETLAQYAGSVEGRVLVPVDEPANIIGYAVGWFRDERVQYMDMAFDPNYENREEAVTALLTHALDENPKASSGMVNVSEYDLIVQPMQDLGYKQSMRQYEMRLTL